MGRARVQVCQMVSKTTEIEIDVPDNLDFDNNNDYQKIREIAYDSLEYKKIRDSSEYPGNLSMKVVSYRH